MRGFFSPERTERSPVRVIPSSNVRRIGIAGRTCHLFAIVFTKCSLSYPLSAAKGGASRE
jgi:hypothetical protein